MTRNTRLWVIILFPSLQVIAGFIVVRRFGLDVASGITMLVFDCLALYTASLIMGEVYIDMRRAQAFEERMSPPARLVTVNAEQAYAMTTQKVVIDIERVFARALMEFPEDLTERKWIKSGVWKSWGGAGREQFTGILTKWETMGVIARRGTAKSAPYFVVSKGRLARVAGG